MLAGVLLDDINIRPVPVDRRRLKIRKIRPDDVFEFGLQGLHVLSQVVDVDSCEDEREMGIRQGEAFRRAKPEDNIIPPRLPPEGFLSGVQYFKQLLAAKHSRDVVRVSTPLHECEVRH